MQRRAPLLPSADANEIPGPGVRHVEFSFYMQGTFWNEQSMTLRSATCGRFASPKRPRIYSMTYVLKVR